MAIPAYLWLKDDGGADIKGSVDVQGREGSIEVVALDHDVYIPTCLNTVMMQQGGNTSEFPAAWSTYYYKTSGTQNGDWCLPAGGILKSYRKNKKTIDASFNKAGGEVPDINNKFHWSSSQQSNGNAWGLKNYDYLITSDKRYINEVRPVLEF